MEIDPKYADCICPRWQEYTGKQAVLEGDGRTFAAVSEARCAGGCVNERCRREITTRSMMASKLEQVSNCSPEVD
jgi:hypothetical protein